MSSITNEKAFDDAIVDSLVNSSGYIQGDDAQYSRELALDKTVLFQFIQDTQKKMWDELEQIHGVQVESKFLQRLCNELDNRGMLDVLRNGVIDYGKKFQFMYLQPVTGLNPETEELYEKNILTVTRQVHYSTKTENSIDLLLSLNGLPVATIELKNQFTGQNVDNAKRQYKYDRDSHELLFQFKKRVLVHFAVDTDEAYMTTRLQGSRTRYLPFNLGYDKGAGNPPCDEGKHRTSYLWEYVWSKDSWLDILGRFIHLEKKELVIDGRKVKKETLIFPRFHQLDVVRKLTQDAKENGTGRNYLIQHSAGSGKSNSIAWLAYRLSGLHDNQDRRIFNSVIVITDRVVLDRQLQDTIYQFEHKSGVVEKIDKDSQQLAHAIKSGTNIIITTLQKFPFVLDEVAGLEKKNYAVIVDEAHSSQGGETAKKMKEALSSPNDSNVKSGELDDDVEDEIRASMLARGKQPNLSFFAFTATPKPKTLEVFGEKDERGKPRPFHLYAMRQAIEEGFILDVLDNYTTYKVYYRLSKHIEDDPKVNKKKAARAIARFLTLHPHNLAQKTEVIIEHFRQFVMKKIGGKAKAMVVTSSREHVVRYKQEFDRYLKEKGYSDIKALVAFSGSVLLDGIPPEYTEAGINSFSEKELPAQFDTSEYQLLLVAEKYQTGYDQPLLHTMYVDKRLDGVKAVQTLSRLNRTTPGKEDTFILDFVNKREDILEAFQPYYEMTTLESIADPNKLYDLKIKIESYQIIFDYDVDAFCNVFFKKSKMHNVRDHAKLNALVDCAVERFKGIEKEEDCEDLANILIVFVRLYAFLSQVIPFSDIDLEKFYAYVRFLLKKLPKRNSGEKFHLGDDVALEYYRLQKIKEGVIPLEKGVAGELYPVSGAGDRSSKEEYAALSEIINLLNDRFGTDFTAADKLFFDQIEEELVLDQKLSMQAQSNTIENFKYGFEDAFINKLIDRMDQNQDIFNKIMEDKTFSAVVKDYLVKKVYKRLNEEENSMVQNNISDRDTLFFNDVIPEGEDQADYLPVYSLEAIATNFGEEVSSDDIIGWWKNNTGKKIGNDMFVAQVRGRSMESTIMDGDYCIFHKDRGGTRDNKIVIVAFRDVSDPETMAKYTIKHYHSEKSDEEGSPLQKKTVLSPANPDFEDIVLEDADEGDYQVVGIFVDVIKEGRE